MPTLTIRKAGDVPPSTRVSKAIREKQLVYESFINDIADQVGELELAPTDDMRRVKVSLTRAATRLGTSITTWEANGKVYFRKQAHRGRPRKAKAI
jgi:hypothetical protein